MLLILLVLNIIHSFINAYTAVWSFNWDSVALAKISLFQQLSKELLSQHWLIEDDPSWRYENSQPQNGSCVIEDGVATKAARCERKQTQQAA